MKRDLKLYNVDTPISEVIEWYLKGEISFSGFRQSVMLACWNSQTDDKDYDLIGQVSLYLAEYDRGHRTEEEIREWLKKQMDTDATVAGSG